MHVLASTHVRGLSLPVPLWPAYQRHSAAQPSFGPSLSSDDLSHP